MRPTCSAPWRRCPFLDRTEMVAVSGWSRGAVYEAVEKLDRGGFCDAVTHAADFSSPTERYYLTAEGLKRLAGEEDMSLDEMLRSRPVSAQWRRSLMERLDALATVYLLAGALAAVAYPIRFRWYRSSSLDAAVSLPDGRTVGIVRRGNTSDRSAFSNRMWRLRGTTLPGAVLILMPDPVRLRHSRRMLEGFPVPAFLAVESEVAAAPDGPVWSPHAVRADIDLRSALEGIEKKEHLPEEAAVERASLPSDFNVQGRGWDISDYMLPVMLKGHREAGRRAGGRLALDRPHGTRRADGGLPPEGLPACHPPGILQACGPPTRCGRTPGPYRPGTGPPSPQRPHLHRPGQEAVERRPSVHRRQL